jgi:hypothetical protein
MMFCVIVCQDLNVTNTCDEGDDLSGLGLNGSFPIFSSNLTLANCSLAEKMARLQQYQVRHGSGGSVIKLPPGAGSVVKNYEAQFRIWLRNFTTRLLSKT